MLLDGLPVRSCRTSLSSAQGKKIITIEGLDQNGKLHPVQQAFIAVDAMQCGYCNSGMIMSAAALLKRNADPSETDIRNALQGNICRCGTYPRIVEAVRMAARMANGGQHG